MECVCNGYPSRNVTDGLMDSGASVMSDTAEPTQQAWWFSATSDAASSHGSHGSLGPHDSIEVRSEQRGDDVRISVSP